MRLRDGLVALLGGELVALWVYGAVTFSDRPARLGDVDTHAVLKSRPDKPTTEAIDELHDAIAGDSGIEWDSWYILESDTQGNAPPHHALRSEHVDDAWALHRAHWLAGRFVAMHGREPSELVRAPSWDELEEALYEELVYIEELRQKGRDDPAHTAFMVWNTCRINYSLETRDVVVSKRAAAQWALEHMPSSWHPAVRAAGRVYDGQDGEADAVTLRTQLKAIVSATRARFRPAG